MAEETRTKEEIQHDKDQQAFYAAEGAEKQFPEKARRARKKLKIKERTGLGKDNEFDTLESLTFDSYLGKSLEMSMMRRVGKDEISPEERRVMKAEVTIERTQQAIKDAEALYVLIHEITYHKVRFHAKSNPADQEDVSLAVDGEILVMQREREVIVPSNFLECARNGTYPTFRQMPNEPRKVTGKIQTFPFDMIGDSTREEFVKQKAEGTKQTLEHVKRFGFNAAPDASIEA